MRYFSSFPSITYSNNFVVNIFAKVQFTERFAKYKKNFLPYMMKERERPDMIAYDYYSDQYNDWIVYFSNKSIDPYYSFYLSDTTFRQHLEKKYGSLANSQQTIVGYRNNWNQDEQVLSQSAFDALPKNLKKYWTPVISIYGSVSGYERAKLDTSISTNKIISITIGSSANSFIVDEKVVQSNATSNVATGVVSFANSTTLMVKHITGDFTANTSLALKGITSGADTIANDVKLIKQTLPENELIYYSAYTAYDVENEKNESKRAIDILDVRYAPALERQMRNLLSEQQ